MGFQVYFWGRRKVLFFLCVMVLAGGSSILAALRQVAITINSQNISAVHKWLTMVVEARTEGLLKGDPLGLDRFYDVNVIRGKWALEHEVRRINYFKDWAQKRGIRIVDVDADLRICNVELRGDTALVSMIQDTSFIYRYRDTDEYKGTTNPGNDGFRIATCHSLELVRNQDAWRIRREWYTDPLDEDTVVPEVRPAEKPKGLAIANPGASPGNCDPHVGRVGEDPEKSHDEGRSYNREAAAAYADKYWHRYNREYRDYTGNGGDCTNFASQVLGDSDAGGLPPDGSWFYRKSPFGAGGSKSWVQAEYFADYLIYSGRARRLLRGGFQEVNEPTSEYPRGAINELEKGDLIGYEEKGRIEHFAVVTGRDSRGYVLVNSHTADRYHVPWDLGWDRDTVFWLLKVVA